MRRGPQNTTLAQNAPFVRRIAAALDAVPFARRPLSLPEREAAHGGILKTLLPRDHGDLAFDRVNEMRAFPLLREICDYDNLASAEIERHGFPLNPAGTDRLKAPASVAEAYLLREAYRDWNELLGVILCLSRFQESGDTACH